MRGTKLIFIFLVCILVFSLYFLKYKTLQAISKSSKAYAQLTESKPFPVIPDDANEKLNQIIGQNPQLEIAVSVIDLNTGQTINAGASQSFIAASTTKLLSSVAYVHMVEEGEASFDQSIGGASAIYHLKRMLNQSDNASWANIDGFITYKGLEKYAHEIGISSYDRRYNTITSAEAANLLQKLYKGQLIYTKNRDILFKFMQNTEDEDLIPPALPANTTFYHKAGYLYGNLHDIAIIDYRNHTIAFAIYTNNPSGSLADFDSRVATIHEITKTIFK